MVCNPPYISQAKLAGERAALLENEPREAFDGGPYGLSIHQRVVQGGAALPQARRLACCSRSAWARSRQVKMLFERTRAYEDTPRRGQRRRRGARRGRPQDQPERQLMELKKQVRDFVTANFYVADPAALEDRTSLLDQGIIDSTGVLEVIMFIETTFGVAVQDSEMLPENLDSIERIAAFVARKTSQPVPLAA